MRSFELYGTVGAVICCLDSLNYLLTQEDLEKCFSSVQNYLDPDGLFLFDVNTPCKFETVYGDNAYLLEAELPGGAGVFCGWQNCYSRETKLCEFDLSIFHEQEDGRYLREDEHQTERCYSMEEIKSALAKCRLEFLGVFSDFAFSAPDSNCQRWYFAARAKKD